MASPFSRTLTIGEWAARLHDGSARGFKRTILTALVPVSKAMVAAAQQNATTSPHVRSGRLRGGIRASVEWRDGAAVVAMTDAAPYGYAQEFGAVIWPRRARYLSIPISGEAKKAYSPRSMAGLFAFRAQSGKLFLGRREGGRLAAHWRLHPGPVKLPAHFYMRRAIESTLDRIDPVFRDSIDTVVGG